MRELVIINALIHRQLSLRPLGAPIAKLPLPNCQNQANFNNPSCLSPSRVLAELDCLVRNWNECSWRNCADSLRPWTRVGREARSLCDPAHELGDGWVSIELIPSLGPPRPSAHIFLLEDRSHPITSEKMMSVISTVLEML